ncbi:MAG: TetR/AcrR family transcriptional regulator [Antricoccus sp.]
MSGDGRAQRHQASRNRILAATWTIARRRGLGSWSLRDVADAVGMRPPSLYVYFDSKSALYDAMFADGYRELLAIIEATPTDGAPLEVLRRAAHLFFNFSVADPARFQLLFLRTLPGFVPSAPSYLLAQTVLDKLGEVLRTAGAHSPQQVDLWTAVFTGLASQQISNDPGGHRWQRLVNQAVDFLHHAQPPNQLTGDPTLAHPPP